MDVQSHRRAGTDTRLSDPFKDKFWWWEGMLMGRRLLLIILSVLPVSVIHRQALLSCGCIMILSLQVHCQPFHADGVNLCESAMLICLAMISVLSSLQYQVDDANLKAVLVVFTLLPVVMAAACTPWRADWQIYWSKLKDSSIGKRCFGSNVGAEPEEPSEADAEVVENPLPLTTST